MKKVLNNIGLVALGLILILTIVFGIRALIAGRRAPTMTFDSIEEVTDPVERDILETSRAFWTATEETDGTAMRAIADPNCTFVHIGMTCKLEQEIGLYTSGMFKPTSIDIHGQTMDIFGDTAIVITDCDYALLLGASETSHHFAVTEVYQQRDDSWKLIQFSFTALVN